MARRVTPLRLPDLGEACPVWRDLGYVDWETPLTPDLERSRSLGESVVFDRDKRTGKVSRGTVVGSASPAKPSAGDLLRRGESLCARGVVIERDDGRGAVVVQSTRLRELRRTPRPMEPGLRLPWWEAESVVVDARAALELGDVAASDYVRAGTLPYPHRAGSSVCSGEDRPARVLEDLATWRNGDGFDGWTAEDVLARAGRMAKGRVELESVDDIERAALLVEADCVNAWDDWVERGKMGRRAQVAEKRKQVRDAYATARKRKR